MNLKNVLASLIEQELPFDFSDQTILREEPPSPQHLPTEDAEEPGIFLDKDTSSVPTAQENNSIGFEKFADEMIRLSFPSDTEIFKGFKYPKELHSRPAFCRRCFKFWRSVAINTPNSLLLEYCCTNGQRKGILREKILKY